MIQWTNHFNWSWNPDKPTPVNFCNHTYFQLGEAGHQYSRAYASRSMLISLHRSTVNWSRQAYWPFCSGKQPWILTIRPQSGKTLLKLKADMTIISVLNKKPGEFSMAAQLYDPRTGRQVEILTTQPGVQFYSGEFPWWFHQGKRREKFIRNIGGSVLKPNIFPIRPIRGHSRIPILKPGEKFSEKTVYRFSVLKWSWRVIRAGDKRMNKFKQYWLDCDDEMYPYWWWKALLKPGRICWNRISLK